MAKLNLGRVKGEPGKQGEPGRPGRDAEGASNNGSFSSDELIINHTNLDYSQVNVSEDSSAGSSDWFMDIGEESEVKWEVIDMGQLGGGDWELEYLVDGRYVYATIGEFGGYIEILVINKEAGPTEDGYELYPVNEVAIPCNTQVNASIGSKAIGLVSQVNASSNCVADGYNSQVNASSNSAAYGYNSQINSSKDVVNRVANSSAYGSSNEYGEPPSRSNIKIHLFSETGDIKNSGVVTSGHSFTDFAELFPNVTLEKQGYGLIQTIDGYGVRPANQGEQIVGVTSATAGIILGETPFTWQARWIKDEWGAYVMEDVLDESWDPSENEDEDDRPTITIPKENPLYNHEEEHLTRQERPDEWTVVGLTGQVYVRLTEDVEPMDYVKPLKDGVGQVSKEQTGIRVMKITQQFNADKGYKIGLCLLR